MSRVRHGANMIRALYITIAVAGGCKQPSPAETHDPVQASGLILFVGRVADPSAK